MDRFHLESKQLGEKSNTKKTDVGAGFFRLSETDKTLGLHWKSGSLKYRDFELLSEGGIAQL